MNFDFLQINMQNNKVQDICKFLHNDFSIPVPEIFSHPPLSDMGFRFQSQLPCSEAGSTKLSLGNASITSITSSYVGSTSALSTAEKCMSLPPVVYDRSLYSCFQLNSLDLPASETFEPGTTLSFENNQSPRSSAKSCRSLYSDLEGSHLLELLQKSAELDNKQQWRPTYISFKGDLCNEVGSNPYIPQVSNPVSCFQQKKQCPKSSSGISATHRNSALSRAGTSSKTRIRWTQDLHKRFVECVNHLGGAEKATPKEIFKLMDISGLTILHIKSHLQNYRTAMYITKSKGKSEERFHMHPGKGFDPRTGTQIAEALRLQLEVQRCLHDQLEVQNNIQSRIEEQGRQLKKLLDAAMTNEAFVQSNDF